MTIYAELLFVENGITGAAILLLTSRFLDCRPERWRITMGAVMCGAYAFVLFVPLRWFVALILKMLFSAAVILVVFGWSTVHNLLKTAGIFYIVSFLMGGVTIGMMYMLKIPGMTGNGSFVLKGAAFLQIAAGVAITWYLGNWLAELLRDKCFKQRVMHQVTVQIAGKSWMLKALTDTGNSLRDPVTGKTVAVLSKSIADEISGQIGREHFKRIAMIPYKTVSGPGLMYGIRPDSVTVDGQKTEDIILGLGDREFALWKGAEKYDLLLHQQFLEGEE